MSELVLAGQTGLKVEILDGEPRVQDIDLDEFGSTCRECHQHIPRDRVQGTSRYWKVTIEVVVEAPNEATARRLAFESSEHQSQHAVACEDIHDAQVPLLARIDQWVRHALSIERLPPDSGLPAKGAE